VVDAAAEPAPVLAVVSVTLKLPPLEAVAGGLLMLVTTKSGVAASAAR